MAEIHQEMSELLDKQVNAQKEKISGVHASSRKPTKKVCDENERNKEEKNDARVKILLMEGGHLYGIYKKLVPWISTSFNSMIVDTMKVLFV